MDWNLEFNTLEDKSVPYSDVSMKKSRNFKTQARAKEQMMLVEDMNTENKMDKDRRIFGISKWYFWAMKEKSIFEPWTKLVISV